jgi:hypothetical protein
MPSLYPKGTYCIENLCSVSAGFKAGEIMKRPMTIFKMDTPKIERHTFVQTRKGMAYAEYGRLKTFSNRTQAQKKVNDLISLGFKVCCTVSHPFLIVPVVSEKENTHRRVGAENAPTDPTS